jgi:hypothetical protein
MNVILNLLFLLLFTLPAVASSFYQGIEIPVEISDFNRIEVIDNESTSKGLGVTISYGSPGIKATVFIYNKGIADLGEGINNRIVQAHAQQAIQDIFTVHPDAKVLDMLNQGSGSCASYLRVKVVYDEGQDQTREKFHSYLYLGSKKGNFIKVRVSYPARLAFAKGVMSESRFMEALCASTNN